jgi:uncharacterized protein (TIGR00303 family)
LRPLTPAADAEVVSLGRPLCLGEVPSNPSGAPGPAGITRAALQLADIEARFVGSGWHMWPAVACEQVPDDDSLFQRGVEIGRAIEAPYLVLAESVPGGTTTALALLLALGYSADGRVSGSMPGNAHVLKSHVAHRALASTRDPLRVGDPMQPLAAGIALGAPCDVLLAGGSQMIAVAALMRHLAGTSALERIAIGTTRWVVDDPAADAAGLAREVSMDLPLMAVNLDFSRSRHRGLRQYEQFLVKEGVGAGGASIAALLATGCSLGLLHDAIDTVYDGLLGRLTAGDTADTRRR